jgi:putative ABC transport system permease protein
MRWKYVARRLLKSPMFTLLTVATLAIGIGANSAIFSVIDGVLLKPLPYPHPKNLVSVEHNAPAVNFPHAGMAPYLYFTYKEQSKSFEKFGIWDTNSVSVTGLAGPEQVDSLDVSYGVLDALGVAPLLGRWFSEKDDSPGSAKTVILMYPYWQARFGGDRSVIGRRMVIDGDAKEVIGVMPENFRFLDQKPALLQPMRLDRAKMFLGNFGSRGVARLKPGVSIAQANAEIGQLIPVALQNFPPPPGYSTQLFENLRLAPDVHPLNEDVVGDIGKTLWVLMATIGIVLLIACANVANLLLVRAEGRRHELAIRAALGAGWSQIARELLAESMTLGLLGGLAGLGVAYGAIRILVAMAPPHLPRLDQISLDATVVLFTLAISLFAGLLFGAIPAIKCAAPGIELRAGGRSISQSRERHRARSFLVVVQVALALLLLIGSGLMIRTFRALRNVQPGFTNAAQVQTFRIAIPGTQVRDPEAAVRMQRDILEKIRSVAAVSAAGVASIVPMTTSGWTDPIEVENHAWANNKIPPLRRYKFISPGLLAAMGNTLIAGRNFTWEDDFEKRPVAMVSDNLARELCGNPAAALGKRIRGSLEQPWREIVGVVGDEREDGVDQKAPATAYWPILMNDFAGDHVFAQRRVAFVIRSSRTGTRGFLDDLQRAVWSVNPDLPLAQIATLQSVYEKSLARTSFTLVLLAIAGAMAMLIGLVGIYGVISYSASQRTREIGIRMALGARKQEVTQMFVRYALALASIGVVCGAASAVAMTRWMSSLLFEVSPLDPATYAIVSGLLICAALVASAIPAWRATTVDPVDALRAE